MSGVVLILILINCWSSVVVSVVQFFLFLLGWEERKRLGRGIRVRGNGSLFFFSSWSVVQRGNGEGGLGKGQAAVLSYFFYVFCC